MRYRGKRLECRMFGRARWSPTARPSEHLLWTIGREIRRVHWALWRDSRAGCLGISILQGQATWEFPWGWTIRRARESWSRLAFVCRVEELSATSIGKCSRTRLVGSPRVDGLCQWAQLWHLRLGQLNLFRSHLGPNRAAIAVRARERLCQGSRSQVQVLLSIRRLKWRPQLRPTWWYCRTHWGPDNWWWESKWGVRIGLWWRHLVGSTWVHSRRT